MPSSSNLNTRVFSPYVVLKQDSSRLAFTIKAGEGYTLNSGITTGSVIRFDPTITATGITGGYTLSRANTDVNSEVVGVVESISGGAYTVVASGSINYPADKLNQITSGGNGGIDVLFLSETVAGGLTGTIDVSSGQEKIVKPVIQVAKHGNYNGIVTNYIGYKTGTEITAQSDDSLIPLYSIVLSNGSFAPLASTNNKWLPVSTSDPYRTAGQGILYSSDWEAFYNKIISNYVVGSPVQLIYNVNIDSAYQTEVQTMIDALKTKVLPTEIDTIRISLLIDTSFGYYYGFNCDNLANPFFASGSKLIFNNRSPIIYENKPYSRGSSLQAFINNKTFNPIQVEKIRLVAWRDNVGTYADIPDIILYDNTNPSVKKISSYTPYSFQAPNLVADMVDDNGNQVNAYIKVKNDSFVYRIPEDVTIKSITVSDSTGLKLTNTSGTVKTINVDALCSACGCCS